MNDKSRPDDHAERGVDHQLSQKQPAEARRGIVQRRRRALQIVRARQPDQAVSKILALDQDEDDEDDDDAGGRQRIEQWRDQGSQILQGTRVGLAHFNGDRQGRPGSIRRAETRDRSADRFVLLWPVELPAQLLEHVRRTFEGAAARRDAAHRLDLFTHRRLINRQVSGQLGQLIGDQRAQAEDNGECQKDDAHDRQAAGNAGALQQSDRRSEHKTEKNSERDGYEYFSAEIQRRNEQCGHDRAGDGTQQSQQLVHRASGADFSGDQAH